jgi:hypothetical protein
MNELTIAELRRRAKVLGVKSFSKLRKQQLIDTINYATKKVVVHKGDLAITRKLGSAYLRTCEVAEWSGTKRFGYTPRAWRVLQSVLDQHGLTPLSPAQVGEKTAIRSTAARTAYDRRLEAVAERIGAEPTGKLARNLASGRTDLDENQAELIAFKARYRHEHTNYDELLRFGHDRDDAREWREEDERPGTWDEYLTNYGFDSVEAKAMAAVLKDPKQCHPTWFKEAEIALRRNGLDLGELTYERIRTAVMRWRDSREVDCD